MILIQKYGGNTLSNAEKIKGIAKRIKAQKTNFESMIVVVSAMGSTTDELVELAKAITNHPNRREYDMLVSAGERVSMSLLSMSLNDIDCPAVSFTGSQAGIMTNSDFGEARIQEIKPIRINAELGRGQVVVLAGFQGVNPETKDVTTLGRGGSDTTAVAMTAHFKAKRCEILKDIQAVMSADPSIEKSAIPIDTMSHKELRAMTYWGAEFLHYRAAELASALEIDIFFGPADNMNAKGTLVTRSQDMYENPEVFAITSHERVMKIELPNISLKTSMKRLTQSTEAPTPQILDIHTKENSTEVLITGSNETLQSKLKEIKAYGECIDEDGYSTVTAICRGGMGTDFPQKMVTLLETAQIHPTQILFDSNGVSFLIKSENREKAIQALHSLIQK